MARESTKRRPRVRAPELTGRSWLNTAGATLRLSDLRGRFVLLDFWTFCCVNCLHVLDELRPLEEQYADSLVVVGVHSPKFEHEADPAALLAAVERYDVEHPVLDDPRLVTWRAYTARAWPTLVLIDPEGYIVAQYAGEGHGHAIAALLDELVGVYAARGTLQSGTSPAVAVDGGDADLRFPAKALASPDKGFLVADAGHHSLVELAADLAAVVRRIGSGERGLTDGAAESAAFNEPNGLCRLPPEVADAVGYDIVVADTGNHALRGVEIASGHVTTLAGNGKQWMHGDGTRSLSSPWDVAWWRGRVWIAMAGIHQLWTFDPLTGSVEVAAGTGIEGLLDGSLDEACFAQPSGLAADGERLWVADAEVSALRWLDADGVHTAVGQGLFEFGFRDGDASSALLQHPLGVAVLADRSVVIADTYNNAVRRYAPAAAELTTMAAGLPEVSGLAVTGESLVAVESAAHRLSVVELGSAVAAPGSARTAQRPTLDIAPGDFELAVDFTAPPGQRLDERSGAATRLVVEATPPDLVRSGAGAHAGLVRRLGINALAGGGVLHIAARAASCDEGVDRGAACWMHQQDWGIPVRVSIDGVSRLELALGGEIAGTVVEEAASLAPQPP
ncbi:MAG: NHL domain-containing thioredoxin family protein [Nocardioidaceae bacterium]